MPWIIVGVVAALLMAGAAFWWMRRRRRPRLIAFVALQREPMPIDPAVLAKVAGRVWKADLGDGTSEGADGFIAGVGLMNTILYDGRMFLVNSFPTPYTEDVEQVAEGIADRRSRELFLEHRAWFSCDALGVDGATPEEEIADWYRRLGKLFAELLDDNCLLIFLPDSGLAYPINDQTRMALRSKDPLKRLQESLTVPIIEVRDDDPEMVKAVQKARDTWPEFVAAYEAGAGENFSIKAPVTHADNTEFIWISVTSLEGERAYGELGNDPGDLGPLKLGSKVSVLVADLNDWCYIDAKGNLVGGYTIEVVQKASRRPRKN
jgi:uncharacterized protein YegJ (DUF2314 family)